MSHGGFEASRKKAFVNCSMAIMETIRSYGFAATLDLVVRISNYDAIVSDVLPYFPSLASAAMMEASSTRPDSKISEESCQDSATQSEVPKTSEG